jgi:hypothetical protein
VAVRHEAFSVPIDRAVASPREAGGTIHWKRGTTPFPPLVSFPFPSLGEGHSDLAGARPPFAPLIGYGPALVPTVANKQLLTAIMYMYRKLAKTQGILHK